VKHTSRLIIALVVVALTMRAAGAVTITNPDFEAVQIGSPFKSANPSDIPGWTHAGADGDALLWAIGFGDISGSVTAAGSGKQFVTLGGGFDISGSASWSTNITGLAPGTGYLLKFMMANEGDFSGHQQITVDFPSGSSTGAQTFTATQTPTAFTYWLPWEDEELVFVATDTTATVRFLANTQFDVGLDNVRVSVVSTPTPTRLTGTPTPTNTPPPPFCTGDCDGSGAVTVNEIIILVNIALGTAEASACPNGIPSGSSVDITLIVKAVNNALTNCPAS